MTSCCLAKYNVDSDKIRTKIKSKNAYDETTLGLGSAR